MSLKFVICGMEHSGTTLLSDLFRQSGVVDSGFECGVLMASSPSSFEAVKPYYANMLEGWKISAEQLKRICDTDSFEDFYLRLAAESELIRPKQSLFDKTPRYIADIGNVMRRTDAPILCINKDPRATVYSDYKRSRSDNFDAWFESYVPTKIGYMRKCYDGFQACLDAPARVATTSLESLCFNARQTCEMLFEHVGVPFEMGYMLMEGLRYQHTRKNFISAAIVFEYRTGLMRTQIARVEREMAEFSQWFYE